MSARQLRLGFLAGLAILAILALGLVGLWGWSVLPGRVAVWAGVVLAGVVSLWLLAAFVLRTRLWPPAPEVAEERAAADALRRLVRQLLPQARAISAKPLSVPWYLVIGEGPNAHALIELGYVQVGQSVSAGGLMATAWAAPHGVALRVAPEAGPEAATPMLAEALYRVLRATRPSLGLNAVFVEASLVTLAAGGSADGTSVRLVNRFTNRAGAALGVDLPVHLWLTGLETLPDIASAAQLTGMIGPERPLGGFLDPAEGDLPAQVAALFDEIIAGFDSARFGALERQLSPEYCAALVNAPMQLALLRHQLVERAVLLAQPYPPRQTPLELSSIFFSGAGAAPDATADPLGTGAASRFFEGATLLPSTAQAESSITARAAAPLAAAYRSEAFTARENAARGLRRRIQGATVSGFLLALVATFGGLSVESYLAHRAVNARIESAFTDYYDAVGALGVTSDTLVQRVLLLEQLRTGLTEYDRLDARLHRTVLPDWSMAPLYRRLYETELTGGFQLSLLDYLEKEMFAYNALGDGVTLMKLATLDARFFADQRRHAARLSDYFITSLAEQGEASAPFQEAFGALMSDLFALNRPPAERDEELRTVVAQTLVGLDTADLLYATLLRRPGLARRIDLTAQIGPHFPEVFAPMGEVDSFLVRRAFTAAGFAGFFDAGEVRGLFDLVETYESVIGALDPGVRATLSRRVAQLYTADYIAAWSEFLGALKLREAEHWTEAQILMRALTSPADNPVERLSAALGENLALSAAQPASTLAEAAAEAPAPSDDLPAAGNEVEPADRATPAAAAAANIRAALRPYLDATRAPEGQQSELDLFLDYARELNLWVETAANAAGGPGPHLFSAYQKSETANPLSVLAAFSSRSQLAFVREFGNGITKMINRAAMVFVRDHIDRAWAEQVRDPFREVMARTFPFDPAASTDVSLEAFTSAFAPNGTLDVFTKDYLAGFVTADGRFQNQPTFLPRQRVGLSAAAKAALTRIDEIRSTMFTEGKPFLAFRQRTGFMQNTLSRIEISAGRTLHRFTHGPVVWEEQEWPAAGLIDNELTMRAYARSRAVINRNYPGAWSWFRLSADGESTLNPELGVAEAQFATDQGALALQFDTEGVANPFVRKFFSGLVLPEGMIALQE